MSTYQNMEQHKPCRWLKGELIPQFEIDARGQVRCSIDHEFPIEERVMTDKRGKSYKFNYLRVHGGQWRWLHVHRLVCYSWLGAFPHPLRFICDHRDGDSLNNAVWNMRYVTQAANNLNRRGVNGIVKKDGRWYPKFCHYVHTRFGSDTEQQAREIRKLMREHYIRYSNRFPEADGYPHSKIWRY